MNKLLRLFCSTYFLIFGYHLGTAQIVSPKNDTIICAGESVTLQAAPGSYMYNWNTGDLEKNITVSPITSTTYSLRVFIPDRGTELIANGDFDSGNTGFYSEYVYCPEPVLSSSNHSDWQSLWEEGRYTVDDNPSEYHSNFANCTGHTGNSPDNYLIVNGSPDENVVIWSQTITVNPNQYYAFSTWACNVHPTNPARLEFMIDGVLMGDYIEPSSGSTCNWEEFYSLWYSGSKTSIEISIVNKNLIRSGNDYALDGISFNPLIEVPDSRVVNVVEPAIVNAGPDQTICANTRASLSASATNYTGFSWASSGDGTFTRPNSFNSKYIPGDSDIATGTVVLTALANANSPCGVVTDNLTLTINPAPNPNLGDLQISCNGSPVILDAGEGGVFYQWSTGERSSKIDVTTSGNYSVIVANSYGCIETDDVYVDFVPSLNIDLGPDITVCEGEAVVLDAGISNANYLWSTGDTTQQIVVYSAGNYSVTVSNDYGCNDTDDINVSLNPLPVVDLGPDQELTEGDVIRLDAGVHAQYIWDNGHTGRYLDVDIPGLYAVRVYDSNGCSAMDMVNISGGTGSVPDINLNDTIICRGESVELFAGEGFLFNWDVDGLSSRVVVSPDSTQTYHLRAFYIDETIEMIQNGNFNLGNVGFTSDYYFCSDPIAKDCKDQKSKYTINSNTTILGGGFHDCVGVTGNSPDNVMVVKGAEANYTVWEQTIDVDPDSYYVFSVNITNLHSNSYDEFEVLVNGVRVDHFYTDEPCDWDLFKSLIYTDGLTQLTISIDNVSTSGVGNGYALDEISMFKLAELPLDVTVTVVQNVDADAGSDLSICESETVSLNGTVQNESSFEWRTLGDGTFDDNNNLITNYTPGLNDIANGYVDLELSAQPVAPCTVPDLDTLRVDINSNLSIDLGLDRDLCQGDSITLTANFAGGTYLWNTGETSQSIVVKTAGNYSVVVADINGCTGTDDVEVRVHSNPVIDLGPDQVTCDGVAVMLDAGDSGSSYIWSNGETNQTISTSIGGNYNVVVTDANGCVGMDDVNIIVNMPPTVNLGPDRETCAGGTVTLDAGNAGSSYLWSNGATTQTITVSASGNYSVVVTDANGCSATDDVNVTVHPNPIVDLGSDQEACAGGAFTLDAGNAGSSYLWSNGATTQTITVSASGNYSVVVTDANGCSATDDVNVTVHPNPVVDLGLDQETCSGGTITLDAGNPGSSYLWSNGATTQTIIVSTSGNYSVVVTDANGCSATDDVNVTVHPNPVVDLGLDQETCAGGTVSLDAGNAGSSYLWSNGATTQTITVSTSGNYSVVVTDANGCSATDDVNVTVHPNPVVDLGLDQETCAGGTVSLDAGNAGSSYLWSNGATTQTIIVSTSGNYSVVVTDANGCSATDDVNVTVHPNPVVDLGTDQETCEGGSITLDAGNAGATYLWSNGATTQTITVSTSGNYSVVVTDANGCSATDDVNVTVHPNPIVDLGPDQETCAGGTFTLDAGNVGSSYLWSNGATTQTITVNASGNYSVVVTDANGCSATDDMNVTVHPNPIVDLGTDQETCAGGTITLDAGNAGATYLWSNGATTRTITVNTSGNYSVVVTDINGCSSTDDVNVTVHPNPIVDLGTDQEACAGGTITLDAGNAGSTYLWSNGATTQTITVSTSGNYSVVVTDANGCSATDDVNVTVHPNPVVDLGLDQETCAGGTVSLDAGNPGSSYLWSNGATTQTITVSTSGNYSVVVTDANGCSATDDVNVTVHPNPIVDLGPDQEACAGGTFTLDAGNVGSSYLWSNGATNQTIIVSTSGNYSVVVTDVNGCSATDDVNVTVHPNPIVDLGPDQEACAGGTFTLDAGNVGSSYLWSNGATTQTITVNASGNYSVVVTDANGCSATDDMNVTVHPNPIVDLGTDQETCAGGTITLDAGNAGATYLWSNGATTRTITVNTSGNYSVVVTDINGCSSTDDVNVTVHPNPIVDLGTDQETCAGGTITLDAGNAGSTYLWSNGATTQTITVSTSGNYSVVVTDANGCSATDDVNVTVHPNPIVDLGPDQETCAGSTFILDAGNPGSSYLWSNGATTQTITVSASGNYSVVVTDANGCSATDDVNVTVHPNPFVDLGLDQETCAGGTVTLDAGNSGSSYLWFNGATTQTIIVSSSGNYSVVVTDANGCSATDDVNVTVHPNPVVDLGLDQETCSGGTITLDAGNPGSSYLWFNGATTQTIIVSSSGNYSVVVTDANGCSATDDVNVTVHPNPVVDLGLDQETCFGGIITLDAGNPGSSYLWSNGATTQTIIVSTSGNYSVVVTDANGCSATDDVNVNILPAFEFDLTYTTNLVCYGDSTYIEGPSVAGYRYQWSKDGVDIAGANDYSITIGESGRYNLQIENLEGCIAEDGVDVEIIQLPNSPLPDRVDMCYGETVKLDIGEGVDFLWSDGVTTQTREVSEAGIYHVRVQDINGCIGNDSVEVVIHDLPIVDLGPDLYICEGEELILEAPDGYYTEWVPGGETRAIYVYEEGNFILKTTDEFGCTGEDDINIFVHKNPEVYLGRDTVIAEGTSIILDAGSGYVEYEWSNQEDSQYLKVEKDGEYAVNVVDVNGCRGNGKVKVAVNPRPSINLGGSAGICEGTSLMLDAGNWERYLWNTGDTTRTITVNKTGDYTVQVWDVYGIMGTDIIHVEVYPLPEVNVASDTLSMYKGQTLTLDIGSGYSSYYWNTGSDWRSIEVDDAGDYSVQVKNDFGCIAQASIAVKLLEPKMVVPNVFTPNGKGPNEIFYPVFKGIVTDFEMYIYTRWGEQVFKLEKDMVANNELKYEGWNGIYKGKDAEIGVYVWIIFYGGKERGHGTVTLFR
ncbi:gliding motility-associated C-terminal domain-containing protein [Marinifilum fragile]|uniref:T9SS type B sorting domain-containing protein n=1 Tax=Marinifilum fragile TaxID=570161 RepID=UPI002AAADF57|nr:gliding motility-associated C-terminal domain-containing protein [Marinifilum fragile]